MPYRNGALLLVIVILAALLSLGTPATPARAAVPRAEARPSLFGMNMYITGQERSEAEAATLVGMAGSAGMGWTREEICWACWGQDEENRLYDRRLGMLANAGIGIIGMLLTTPEKYRDRGCVAHARATSQPAYWCQPTDMDAYARWAAMVVERYDGDGVRDAPGSPRVAAWEIWNEPDMDGTWLPQANPGAYAQMLRKAHDAIKAADPTALVLNGGVYVFDGVGQGSFMDRVVELAGWDSFDVLSIHPWLIDHAPDDPSLINPRERFDVTVPGRIGLAQRWAAARGGKPVWVTEVGWSTCGGACAPQFAKNEEQQANYMVRTFVLAAAAGVEHVSYFQLEDKFSGAQQPWGPAAILNDDLSPKAAYHAYGTLVSLLQFAGYQGTGPAHRPGAVANYRFSLASGGTVDVLWAVRGQQTAELPLAAGQSAALVQRNGAEAALAGRTARLTLGEQPVYVRQETGGARTFAETGQTVRGAFLRAWERGGGLAIYGLPLTPERLERGSDGRERKVQWFERARFEEHLENRPPGDVLIGLLGVEYLARRGVDWQALPKAPTTGGGCRLFPETGQSLCPPFRAYWERNGGLATFGFPISAPAPEQVEGGLTLTVQYFERARFEDHPELPAARRVQLSRLGAELREDS